MEQMKRLLDQVRRQYDYCLTDAPAGLGQGFRSWPPAAPTAWWSSPPPTPPLCGTHSTPLAILDKRFTTESLFLVGGASTEKLLRALHSTIDDAMDAAGLLGVVLEDSDVPYSLNRGIPLRDMNYYAARSYENIARRITGQRVPLMRI